MNKLLLSTLILTTSGTAQAQTRPVFGGRLPVSSTNNQKANSQATTQATSPLGLVILDSKGEIQQSCPLERTDVKADITGTVARVSVVQSFSNPSKEPIEAMYTFPLPHDAAVDGMDFRIGDRLIKGEIKKREEAAQIYQEARQSGRNAALLDQERPNIFTQKVANIVPGQKISVEISFVQPVIYRAGHYEWEFPTVVGPRYVPSGGYTQPGERGNPTTGGPTSGSPTSRTDAVVTDPEKITPPIALPGQRAGHDLTMEVKLQSGLDLGEISSALHPVVVKKQGTKAATISLKDGAAIPNKDFVLRFAPRDNVLQTGLLTKSQGTSGFFQLVLQPPPAAKAAQIAPKEMVFVIDQTGSQSGQPIAKAKETMRHCIKNLNDGDTFQILGFTTDVNPCFEKPVTATPANVETALKFLDGLDAGGGTDILKAANYALKIPSDPGKPRIICFMTDGFVGNDQQILDFVRQNRGQARMFPFGVGNSFNRNLIDGMAREGRGVAEYALLNEDGEKMAERFYNRVAKPILVDVQMDWGNLPVADVYPKLIPDVFESGPVVLTGRFTRPFSGPLTLKGMAAGKPWQRKIDIEFPAKAKAGGDGLPSLWARAKIEDLSNKTMPNPGSGETAEDLKNQITNVALDFKLMSAYTSFVAVESKVVNVGGKQKTVDVPVEMADGVSYTGIFGNENEDFGGSQLNNRITALEARRAPSLGRDGGGNFGGGGFAGGGFGVGGFGSGGFGSSANVVGSPVTPPILADMGGSESKSVDEQVTVMKPEDRQALYRSQKMVVAVQKLLQRYAKEATEGNLKAEGLPEVINGRVTLQIWLNALEPEAATELTKQLKALGWKEDAQLQTGKLLLGSIEVSKLDELAALKGVRMIDVPKFS